MRPETVWLLIFFYISKNQQNTLENGKTQLFNSGGVVKWAKKVSKKVEYPFKLLSAVGSGLYSTFGMEGGLLVSGLGCMVGLGPAVTVPDVASLW